MKRVTQVTDHLGRATGWTYDERGLLSSASRDGGIDAGYTYTALGSLGRITDPGGASWSFEYTPMGRPTDFTDPFSRKTSFAYDSRGRLTEITHADGVVQTRSHDAAGNLIRVQYSDGTDLEYTYDSLNRLTGATGFQRAYDAEGRIINTRQSGLDLGAAYDAGGRLTSVTYPNPAGGTLTVSYTYDTRDRLTGVSDNLSQTSLSLTHDNAGRLIGLTRPNGVNGIYSYDARGLLTRIQEGTLLDLLYTLDAAGQVTQAEIVAAPLDPTMVIDDAAADFTYDAASQITSPEYSYDARGRLTATPDDALNWDGASRLTGLGDATYVYNALGDVVMRTDGGGSVRYFYNHAIGLAPIMAERDETSSQFTRYYVWSPGGLLLYIINLPGNNVSFPLFDRAGSTLALTDGTGAVTDAYAYDAYGRLLARTGASSQPFRFNGQLGIRADGSLYHMRARWYDPMTARFVSREPVWPVLENPKKLNPYEFALQTPLTHVDPDGSLEYAWQTWNSSVSQGNVYSAEHDWLPTNAGRALDTDRRSPLRALGLSDRDRTVLSDQTSPDAGLFFGIVFGVHFRVPLVDVEFNRPAHVDEEFRVLPNEADQPAQIQAAGPDSSDPFSVEIEAVINTGPAWNEGRGRIRVRPEMPVRRWSGRPLWPRARDNQMPATTGTSLMSLQTDAPQTMGGTAGASGAKLFIWALSNQASDPAATQVSPQHPSIPGDYNSDGRVGAADYVGWRATGGMPAEYNEWRENFGRTP